MKPKTLITVVIVTALVVSTIFVARGCRIDGKYRAMKLQYEGYRAIAEADHKMSLDRIDLLNQNIEHMTNKIVQLETEVAAKQTEVDDLSIQLDELQNAEPSQPELESQPLVINLRAQVKTLTEMFSLSQDTVALQKREIDTYVGQVSLLKQVAGEWEANYNREHALRLACESLNKELEHQYKVAKVKGRVATVASAVAIGVIGYQLVK